MVRDIRRQTPSALPATTLDQGPLDVTLPDSSVGIDAVSDSPPSSLGCGWRMWRVSPAHRASTYLYRGREACGMARITSSQRMAATSRHQPPPRRACQIRCTVGPRRGDWPGWACQFCGGDPVFFLPRRERGRGGGGWDTGLQRISNHAPRPHRVARLAPGRGLPLAGVATRRPSGAHASVRDLFASHCLLFPRFVGGGGGVASGTGRQQSLHHPPSPTLPKWAVAIPLRAPLRARPRDPALSPPVRGTPPPAQATATPPSAHPPPKSPARGEVVVGVECVRRAAWSGRVCAACPQTTWQEWCGGGPTPACQHQQQRPHGSAGRCASSDFLPSSQPSVQGRLLLFAAFPVTRPSLRWVPPLFCAGAAWPRSCIRGSHLATVPILLVGPLLSPPRHLSLLLPPLLKTFFC